ncbi:MAG: hypothetical protein H7Y42_09745 [Chitinophagaceae bacterium]|nr:hypothetical protein [Chitinophagaceae bacterium]
MKRICVFLLLTLALSCKKDKDRCWQVYDMLGNDMGVICGKTEAEVQTLYGPFYDRVGAEKYCWKITYSNGTISYPENMTEKMISLWFSANATSTQKIDCGFCERWLTREKSVVKLSGQFMYSQARSQDYCGDTCATLFPGRSILLRETPDSLIYHEFIQEH